jgi:hypothetical protein
VIPEKRRIVTQLRRLADLFRSERDALARQGSIQATYRTRGDRRYGPFYRLIWRRGGRQRTHYLGRAGLVVDQASTRLRMLQKPRRRELAARRRARAVRRRMRHDLREIDRLLRKQGLLQRKGSELRGWRQARNRLRRTDERADLPREKPPATAGLA